MVTHAAESQLHAVIAAEFERLAVRLETSQRWHFKQIEALLNLHALVRLRGALPPSREWTVSPDLLQEYVTQILRRRPPVVLECGSGLSTVWAGYAAELSGPGTTIVALEHEEQYLRATSELIGQHGLDGSVDLRLAPLVEFTIEGEQVVWYDPASIEDLVDVGVVLIDGPPGPLGPLARFPAVPLTRHKLAPGAVIIVDDADRADEAEAIARWTRQWPELGTQRLKHEKGTVLLQVPE